MGNRESVIPIIRDYRDLDVFKKSRSLVKAIYQLTARFPNSEKFALASQLQRAAISVPSNIAEGNARSSKKEYAHFISIAAGSTAEVETLLMLANDLEYLSLEEISAPQTEIIAIRKMLNKLRIVLLS